MSDTCVIAVSFHLPQLEQPRRWYADRDLAELWHVSRGRIRIWRHLARKHGYGPRPDQIRYRRPTRHLYRHAEVDGEYAVLLEKIFITRVVKAKIPLR